MRICDKKHNFVNDGMLNCIVKKLVQQVNETIQKKGMFDNVHKVVFGFSGGPDSVCLLDVLKTIYESKINIRLVYVNHGLRAQKFLQHEERMTEEYAKKYCCEHEVIKIKVPETRKGVEAEARERRYHALIKCADKIQAQRIVLAHNLDDLVETFLMNLLRGSGTLGLQAMPAVRLPFVRPLIDVKKSDVISYLKSKSLRYCCDQSNLDLSIRRNFIRRKIMPQLLEINPQIHDIIRREIEILHNDEEFIQDYVKKAYDTVVRKRENGLAIDFNRLMYYNKAIRNRVILEAIRFLKGDLTGIGAKHIEAIFGLKNKVSGRVVCLPDKVVARKIYGNIFLGLNFEAKKKDIYRTVKIGSEIEVENLRLKSDFIQNCIPEKTIPEGELFDAGALKMPLYVRNRKPGDVVKIKNGRKKLKEILNEKDIPVDKRDKVLLLCDQKGILWVIGIYRAFRAFVNRATNKILKVQFEYID